MAFVPAYLDQRSLVDAELVVFALAGREDSFEELVRRYQRPIIGYVYRMLGNYDSALDVTQETFVKVYSSLSKFCPDYKFSTWLYRIAHNAAIDHIRRNASNLQSLETESDGSPYQFQIESDAPSPEDDRERAEWRNEIDAVVRCLPLAYRELILLRHSSDLSYDEMVEVTGLPLGTVKNRLFRAREMMRTLLIERGINSI